MVTHPRHGPSEAWSSSNSRVRMRSLFEDTRVSCVTRSESTRNEAAWAGRGVYG